LAEELGLPVGTMVRRLQSHWRYDI